MTQHIGLRCDSILSESNSQFFKLPDSLIETISKVSMLLYTFCCLKVC